jgi:hypothetical protein
MINDPGNAGTASAPNGHEDDILSPEYLAKRNQQSRDDDARRRVTSLISGITTAVALITSAVLVPLLDSWTPAGLTFAGWLAVLTLNAGIMNYRYGPIRGKR